MPELALEKLAPEQGKSVASRKVIRHGPFNVNSFNIYANLRQSIEIAMPYSWKTRAIPSFTTIDDGSIRLAIFESLIIPEQNNKPGRSE